MCRVRRLTQLLVRPLDEKAPRGVVHLEASDDLGIPFELELVNEEIDQLCFGFHKVQDQVRALEAFCEVLVADHDGADETIIGSAISWQIIVLALQTVKQGGNVVLRRIGKELATSVDWAGSHLRHHCDPAERTRAHFEAR